MRDDSLTCALVAERLHAHLDGMLETIEHRAIDRHLEVCPACRAELARIRDLEAGLAALCRESPAVPDGLWDRVRPPAPASAGAGRWPLRAAAAAAIAAVAIAAIAPTGVLDRIAGRSARLEAAFVETPLEELRAFVDSRRAVDLATGDLRTLREWFAGKVDHALPAPATGPGIRLVGARLCFFLDRRVASLMYEAEGRTLSLYVIPAHPADPAARADAMVEGEPVVVHEARGYAQVMWRRGPLVHALAADLPAARVLELSRDFVVSTRAHQPREAVFMLLAANGLAARLAPGQP